MIKDSPEGWSQAHFPQFDENFTDEGLTRNQALRQWEFTSTENLVEITTYGSNHSQGEPANISVIIDGQPFIVSTRLCPDNSMSAIAFDKGSTIPYAVLTTGGFDVLDKNRCGRTPQAINTFQAKDINNDLKLDSYLDLLPQGDYTILFSIGQVDYSSWNPSTINKLSSIGININEIGTWQNDQPVIIVGRKGDLPGTALIIRGDNNSAIPLNEQEISLAQVLIGKFENGVVLSPKIGPAESWGTLHHGIQSTPAKASGDGTGELTDNTSLEVLGVTNNGQEHSLYTNVTTNPLDISNVDQSKYPFLRLKLAVEDSNNLTPAQLKRWQVLFESVPEGVLLFRGNDGEGIKKIPLLEGQEFNSNFVFYNLSTKEFLDSLLVRATLFNRELRSSTVGESKILAPSAKDSVAFSLSLDTKDHGGVNDYQVFVNPNILLEQSYSNNINDFQEYIEVSPDDTHPILDVTFDGIHILDGDLVSPSPLIAVLLKDDNIFNLKQDTIGMEMFMKMTGPNCTNCDFKRISFSSPRVQWTPASENSDFRIEYQPEKLDNGIYTLQVQGQDNSGRKSGSQPYTINFEVVNESTITNFYPYPNPFSTSTRFVFTLTGAEIPDQIKIQIMTVTGKVVREITQDELGLIRIGNNITDYAWDGRDEYGDQLANGVYIYRVVMNRNNDNFKHRETSADKAFKKGYGKLYLLR
jgi:flagellar hook assembly protein FlgD